MTAYPATLETLEPGQSLLTATGVDIRDIAPDDPGGPISEAMRHIMTEEWFEQGEDIEALYRYCADRFSPGSDLPSFFLECYLARILTAASLGEAAGIALVISNKRLLPLLSAGNEAGDDESELDLVTSDLVAWEFFRQILGAQLDPMTPDRVQLAAEFRHRRADELEALRSRCEVLATNLYNADPTALPDQVEGAIRRDAADDISALLRLGSTATQDFIEEAIGDPVTWGSTLTTIASLLAGDAHLTLGGAIAATASIGSKVAKTSYSSRRQGRSSPYRILYRTQ
jgi:hypothetical protein